MISTILSKKAALFRKYVASKMISGTNRFKYISGGICNISLTYYDCVVLNEAVIPPIIKPIIINIQLSGTYFGAGVRS